MVWTITLPFLLLLLIGMVGVGNLVLRHSVQATHSLSEQLSEEVGERAVEQLEERLRKPLMLNQLNRGAVAEKKIDLARPESVSRQFLTQLQTFPEVSAVMATDAQGRSVVLTRLSDNQYQLQQFSFGAATAGEGNAGRLGQQSLLDSSGAVLETQAIPSVDLRNSEWYLSAAKQRKKIWDKQFQTGKAIAAQPILNEQEQVELVLAAAVDLSKIDEALDSLRFMEQGQIFILDETGLLFATSTNEVPYQYNPQGQMVSMQGTDSKNSITQAAVEFLYPKWYEISFDKDESFQIPFQRDLLQLKARRYVPYPGADWLIAAVTSRADVVGPIQRQQYQTVLLCGFLLLVSLLLCIGIARHLVRPVRALSRAAKAIAPGNWQVDLPIHRTDELGDLAQSFAGMSQALQQSFRRLEAQNQQLEQQNEDLLRQEAHLKELDRLKDEFLANTSHELRTPLSGILGLAESLQVQTAEPLRPKQAEVINLIVMSAYRLSVLVNDILDLSCLDNHALKLNCGAVNLHSLVQHVLELSQPLAQPRQLALHNAVPSTLPAVYADGHRVQQVLYNLVGNGIKFTHEGAVTVSAKVLPQERVAADPVQDRPQDGGDYVAITITDTGIGIDSEIQPRIFNAFEQGKGEITRMYGGTGLGLAVSKSLIELHGGTIEVRSRPGQGSQFRFTLPLLDSTRHRNGLQPLAAQPLLTNPQMTNPQQRPSQLLPQLQSSQLSPLKSLSPAQPDHSPEHRLGSSLSPSSNPLPSPSPEPLPAKPAKARILIVDDDPTNLRILHEQLTAESYEVVQATTGEQALQILEQTPNQEGIDLVLLDVMMPLMSGYEVCRKLRPQHPIYQLPVIILTAKVQAQDVVTGFNAGANDYLKKPFSRDELLSRIETHLSNRLYGRFVPEHFLRFLEKSTITDIRLGNQVSCDMTVMFSDIRGFTTLSEAMTPQENFDFVNHYLQQVSPEIRGHDGFIVKYLGDGMMAIFPQSSEDAVDAAIAKLRQVDGLNRDRPSLPPIKIGIGIHFGPMKVGIVGEDKRMQGDAFSDDVNLTARLEGLTKFYGVSLLISEQVLNQLNPDHSYQIRYLDQVTVKGRVQPLAIYEVFDGEPEAVRDRKAKIVSRFEAGVQAYQAGDFATAQAHFDAVQQIAPEDIPTRLYCDRIAERRENPPVSDWTGVSDWSQK